MAQVSEGKDKMDKTVQAEQLLQLQDSSQQIADFIAMSEEVIQKLKQHDAVAGRMLEDNASYFSQQLDEIRKTIVQMQNFMTQTGVARFKVLAEKMLSDGQKHFESIQSATDRFQKLAENSCHTLQRVSENSADWIAEAIKSLQIEKFRGLIFENVDRVENTSRTAIQRIRKMSRWFQWEKLGLALVVAVVVSLMTGLFVNDELPWETHSKVVQERNVGRMLMQAWPKLSLAEKERIETAASPNYA